MFGKIAPQIAQDIARAESFVFHASTWLDCDQFFLLARIAHTESRGDGRTAKKSTNLQNVARANLCEVIDENQHIKMQHRILVADLQQFGVNRLVPILHQGMHQT